MSRLQKRGLPLRLDKIDGWPDHPIEGAATTVQDASTASQVALLATKSVL